MTMMGITHTNFSLSAIMKNYKDKMMRLHFQKTIIMASTTLMTMGMSNASIANQDVQSLDGDSRVYLNPQEYSDSVVYSSDGQVINWQDTNKVKPTEASQSCSKNASNSTDKAACLKLDVANLLNDNKWSKNKNYKDVGRIVTDIQQQIDLMGDGKTPYQSEFSVNEIPLGFSPWWAESVSEPISSSTKAVKEDINSLIERAIVHSTQIKVFSDVPIIRETAIYEAKGDFDPVGYFDYRWTDIDDPVGSTLTTGGDGRFLETERLARLGIRKKFITGTEVDIYNQSGVLDNNSEFLVPNNQASSRWSITLTQPLLRGFGVKYNRSNIDIARIDTSIALDEYKRQIESHLLELVRAYWGLYLERASLIQKRQLVNNTKQLVDQIGKRGSYDATRTQLSRVKARLLDRQADMVRSESAVRNAEAKIIALTNDPSLRISPDFELLPSMQPSVRSEPISADMAVALAMTNRPEVNQTFKQVKAGALRLDVSQSELKPQLNFIATYYKDGIAGDGDRSLASDNARDGGNSWILGLSFEYKLGNRTRKAGHRRKQAELRQLVNQLRTTLETVVLEVQVSVREANTSLRKMSAEYAILKSAELNVQSIEKRQKIDSENGRTGSSYLESLLDAQENVSDAEYDFVSSQIAYNVALSNLDRATGMLLQTSEIQPRRFENSDDNFKNLPSYKLEKVRLK